MTDNTLTPTDTPHAELRKTWREGQRWQTRGNPEWEWLDTTPCWWPDQEYRRHPDDFDAVAPAQAGEQKRLPLAITSAPDRIFLDLGCNPYEEDAHFSEFHEVTWSQDNATGNGIEYVRADCAARGAAPASQPFAYEFSRSNGDGTHSEHIERGRLQEVAPGRWEHSGLPRGALADKPIKALYTTPQTQPAAVPASGPVGFDHKTAANFLNGKTVTNEEVRQFVAHSRWAHDDRDWLRDTVADLRREIAQRDAEIALLKTSLLDAESPTQAAQALDAARVFWQQHTQADALSMTMAELHDDVELVIRAARGAAQAAPVDAAVLRDAERWMKLEAEAVRAYVGFNDIWYGSAEDLRHGVDQFPANYAARAAQKGGAA